MTVYRQVAIATILFTLQATLIACSDSGSVTVECFIDPGQDGCDTVSESISKSIPGGVAIADESPNTLQDLCSNREIRNINGSVSREEWAWVVQNLENLSLTELRQTVGEPYCMADGENGIIAVMPDGKEVNAPRWIWQFEGQDLSLVEYVDVPLDPHNDYQPLNIPGAGVVTP
jgi:hypothetical protein